MKVIILAGGMGSRLSEETESKPKPMVEIGGRPILWHIMKHISHYSLNEFIVALGYRGDAIKRYFTDEANFAGDMTIDMSDGTIRTQHEPPSEGWRVELCDTGVHTNTAGRIKRILRDRIPKDDCFMVTYGDGVTDLPLDQLFEAHASHIRWLENGGEAMLRDRELSGAVATLTAVRPPARYGELALDGPWVTELLEKPQLRAADSTGWINGGYIVFEPSAREYFEDIGDHVDLAHGVLASMAADGVLRCHRHDGFWQCMDTYREKVLLEKMWATGVAPWKVWP